MNNPTAPLADRLEEALKWNADYQKVNSLLKRHLEAIKLAAEMVASS